MTYQDTRFTPETIINHNTTIRDKFCKQITIETKCVYKIIFYKQRLRKVRAQTNFNNYGCTYYYAFK